MIQVSHIVFFFALHTLRPTCCLICPKHKGSDPQGVNERILKVASESNDYEVIDASDPSEIYTYEVKLCQVHSGDSIAITQTTSTKPKSQKPVIIGKFQPAPDVFGGVDWALITYKSGDHYKHHCNRSTRTAVIMLTCNPDVKKGTMRVLEEYRTKKKDTGCYYLFELNVAGVCTVKASSTKLSAGSILIIILVVVASLYFSLGFLYMRFIVGAKGKEQIPNYSFWREFGNLQADGCNFICRSSDSRPTRYKTMDDAIGDDNEEDERDETLLPM